MSLSPNSRGDNFFVDCRQTNMWTQGTGGSNSSWSDIIGTTDTGTGLVYKDDNGHLRFTGTSTSNISFPHASHLVPGSGDFTVSVWARNDNNLATVGIIVAKGLYNANGDEWFMSYRAGTPYNGVYFRIRRNGGSVEDVWCNIENMETTIKDGAFHNITAVVERGVGVPGKLYFDGTLVGSAATVSQSVTNTANMIIGKYFTTVFLNGAVDLLSVEKRAWSEEEVVYNYKYFKERFS